MKIKILAILLGVEILTITALGELGIAFDSWNPIIKCLLILTVIATINILLYVISCHQNTNTTLKKILRVSIFVIFICFVSASISEFLK